LLDHEKSQATTNNHQKNFKKEEQNKAVLKPLDEKAKKRLEKIQGIVSDNA